MIPPLVDLHCHFVPEVDDGARTLDDALGFLREFREAGITRVVTTPHLPASRTLGEWRDAIVEGFGLLEARARDEVPEISLGLSYEIHLDDPDSDLTDRSLGLGEGGALLVEFPMLVVPAYPDRMLEVVRRQGWIPVLAHPERYAGIERAYGWVERWRDSGALMCVNAGSLWGEYGSEAERVARRMLASGDIDLLASDHHARLSRSTTVRQAWDFLEETGLGSQAKLLLSENPRAVLEGRVTERVPPDELPNGWIGRLKRFVRGG